VTVVTVERVADGGLSKRVWTFWLRTDYGVLTLLLDLYREFARETRRHGWKCKRDYRRIDKRGATIKSADEVEIPADVADAALAEIRGRITVTKERDTPASPQNPASVNEKDGA
jgi:hypothetical protein